MIEIPAEQYVHFLELVKSVYEKELKKNKIKPKASKLTYWLEKDQKKDYIINSLNLGTVETRHFYYAAKQLREFPAKAIEENENVIIEVLKKIGFSPSNEIEQKIQQLPEREAKKKTAEYLLNQFILSIPKLKSPYEDAEKLTAPKIDSIQIESLVLNFYKNISDEEWVDALEKWDPHKRQSLWSGSTNKFQEDWNNDIQISDTRVFYVKAFNFAKRYAICYVFYKSLYLYVTNSETSFDEMLNLSYVDYQYLKEIVLAKKTENEEYYQFLEDLYLRKGRLKKYTNLPKELRKKLGNPKVGEMDCIKEIILTQYNNNWVIESIENLVANEGRLKLDDHTECLITSVKALPDYSDKEKDIMRYRRIGKKWK